MINLKQGLARRLPWLFTGLFVGLFFSTQALAVCPKQDKQYIQFEGQFDASHCSYEDFRKYRCYPFISLAKPITVDEKQVDKVRLEYDKVIKNIKVSPLVKLGKPVEVKGCGLLNQRKSGSRVEVWELKKKDA